MGNEKTPHWQTGQNIRLEKIMRPVATVTPDTSEKEVLKVLLENKMPGVPVVDQEGLLVGFVSGAHLLASAMPEYLKVMEDVSFVSEAGDEWVDYFAGSADKPVGEVMATEVSHVELGTSEVVAAHKIVHDGVSSVIVTDKGKVVGIVDRLDLYAAIIGTESDQ